MVDVEGATGATDPPHVEIFAICKPLFWAAGRRSNAPQSVPVHPGAHVQIPVETEQFPFKEQSSLVVQEVAVERMKPKRTDLLSQDENML